MSRFSRALPRLARESSRRICQWLATSAFQTDTGSWPCERMCLLWSGDSHARAGAPKGEGQREVLRCLEGVMRAASASVPALTMPAYNYTPPVIQSCSPRATVNARSEAGPGERVFGRAAAHPFPSAQQARLGPQSPSHALFLAPRADGSHGTRPTLPGLKLVPGITESGDLPQLGHCSCSSVDCRCNET